MDLSILLGWDRNGFVVLVGDNPFYLFAFISERLHSIASSPLHPV